MDPTNTTAEFQIANMRLRGFMIQITNVSLIRTKNKTLTTSGTACQFDYDHCYTSMKIELPCWQAAAR